MKIEVRNTYICETCHRRYNTPEMARMCEKGHSKPTGNFWEVDYGEPDEPQYNGWPVRLMVEGLDGDGDVSVCPYVRGDLVGSNDEDWEIPF